MTAISDRRLTTIVIQDPLTLDQKQKIKAYVDGHLAHPSFGRDGIFSSLISLWDPSDDIFSAYKLISKTYVRLSKSHPHPDQGLRNSIKTIFQNSERTTGKSYAAFQSVFKNPAENASELGIDPQRPDQVYAAQVFMKVSMRGIPHQKSFEEVTLDYKKKMTGQRRGYIHTDQITAKHALAMTNDPVQKMSPTTSRTSLNVILAHTHFQNGSLNRESTRQNIIATFKALCESPHTKHIMDAMAVILQTEKGSIFIGSQAGNIGTLSAPYFSEAPGGLYNLHHSIMIGLLPNFSYNPNSHAKGTLVHECLHFIFNRVVQENSSPVVRYSNEERLLDAALAQDREHRRNMGSPPTSHPFWRSFSGLVDDKRWYFSPDGFDVNKPEHLHTMRVEGIVRIMQAISLGYSREEIATMAPHLCEFYFTYSKPLIEKFVKDHEHVFLATSSAVSESEESTDFFGFEKFFNFVGKEIEQAFMNVSNFFQWIFSSCLLWITRYFYPASQKTEESSSIEV